MGWRDPKQPADRPSPPEKPKSKAQRASWRSTSARPASVEPRAARRGWWKSQRTEQSRQMGFRAKLAFWGVVLGLLVAGYVWMVMRAPRKVPLVALRVTQYDDALPPNAWAFEDVERLLDHFAGAQSNIAPKGGDWKTTGFDRPLEDLGEAIEDAPPGGPGKNVILVYLSAHGVVNSDNEPCLLRTSSDPLDESTWLKVSDVLKQVSKSRQEKGQKTRILLALDSNRMLANWNCGQLYNHFADRLKDVVSRHEDKNLVVLNSTSPAESLSSPLEVGWAAGELGGSAFGFFFFQGLRGAADIRNVDGQVDLRELAEYLERKVAHWALDHRVGRQRPCLMPPDAEDFPLVYCEDDSDYADQEQIRLKAAKESWDADSSKVTEGQWSAIDGLWQDHDRLREARVYRYDPLRFGLLERQLLRIEQLMLAGSAYGKRREDLIAEAGRTRDALDGAAAFDISACNLALCERRRSVSDDAFGEAASGALDGDSNAAPQGAAAPAPQDATTPAPKETPGSAPPEGEAPPKVSYPVAARQLWDQLKQGPPAKTAIRNALAKFDARASEHAFDVVEVEFLRMLERYADDEPRFLEQAVASRDLAESAATPLDERAHYWVIDQVSAGDTLRRQAEDLLFVGQGALFPAELTASPPGTAGWQPANAKYEGARQRATEVSKAFDARDRGLLEAPALIEWLWLEKIGPRALDTALDPAGVDDHWRDLKDAIVQLHVLSDELDESLARQGAGDGWMKSRDAVIDHLDALGGMLNERCDALTEADAPHQERVVHAERMLAVAALSADQRAALRRKHHETLERQHNEARDWLRQPSIHRLSADDRRQDAKAPHEGPPLLIDEVAGHPVLVLLELPGEKSPAAEVNVAADAPLREALRMFADRGGMLRKRLLRCPAKAAELVDEAGGKLAQSDPAQVPFATVRQGYSRADRVLRAAAGIDWPGEQTDPTVRLCALDLHQLMLFQAQRAMEDFWGPPPGAADRPASGPSYFETVAGDCLNKAALVCDEAEALRKPALDRLQVLAAAARTPLAFGSDKALEVARDEKQEWTLVQLQAVQNPDAPEGLAAASIDQDAPVPLKAAPSSPASSRRIGFPVSRDAAAKKLAPPPVYVMPENRWLSSEFGLSGPAAVAFYRGHVHREPLQVNLQGIPIEYTPDELIAPTILVRGEDTKPISVMFIFDCSGSMKEADVVLQGRGTTRFVAAREVLLRLLDQLKGDKFQAGLSLYGHRLGWDRNPDPDSPEHYISKASPFSASWKSKQPAKYPESDFEIVLNVGRFAGGQLQLIRDLFAKHQLNHHGATPLYLAIRDSVAHLKVGAFQTRRIVAITDGVNDQYVPGSRPPDRKVIADDLEALFADPANKDIRLDIVGIGRELNNPEKAKDVQDMKRIAEMTGGEYFSTTDAEKLLNHLLDSLRPEQFLVRSGNRLQGPAELNQTITIDPPPRIKSPYDVEVTGIDPGALTRVALEGGEAIKLDLRRTATAATLEHSRYSENLPVEMTAVTNLPEVLDGRKEFYVASHTPDAPGALSKVEFRISIQNKDEKLFSPRPLEAWVDVTPLKDDGTPIDDTVYRFCDMNFVPGKPVPVLSCTTPDFPAGCRKARIDLFFKRYKTNPERTFSVGELTSEAGVRLESAGVRLRAKLLDHTAEGVRPVKVYESPLEGHEQAYRPGRLKIEMQSPGARPRALHDYAGRWHGFLFPPDTNLQQCEVVVTLRENLEREAYHYTLAEQVVPR